ncbi:MAG: AlbA family DNA-binding domain-containing protein [Pseudonocardiaceae bacterium]
MASTHSLLYAAESDVTIERVRALVKQVGPEAPTIEYKEQMADSIARGVAALANTYGGLLLVGVTDTSRIVKGVKERTIESVAEHCAAKIEPPWVPPIIPVPLGQGSDLYVLVLRVVPGQHPRPLLVDGVAPVRHQNTSHPADWQRLRDLFAEAGAVLQDDAWTIQIPSLPQGADGTSDSNVDLIIRSGLDLPVSREAKWRPLSERTVAAFTDALERSSLTSVMASIALGGALTGGSDSFRPRGLNRSRTVTLQWWCAPDGWPQDWAKPVEATVRLAVPGSYGSFNRNLRVEIDVVVRRSPPAEIVRQQSADGQQVHLPAWRITVHQLGELIDAMLATLSGKDVVGPLADLAGIDPVAVPQPRVMHMVTERPVTEVLDTTGLRLIPEAGVSKGAHLLADPALDLADEDDRREQVTAWVTQIALDAGLRGMEQLLQHLAASQAGA